MGTVIRDILALAADGDGVRAETTSVYIDKTKITGIGHAPDGFQVETEIDGQGKLLMPGLVNSHTHAYMTILRNTADDLSFHDWLFGRISPLEDQLTAQDCYWGTQLALMEMLSTGTTCFSDMYIFPHAAAKAVCDAGARAVLSRGLVGGDEEAAGEDMRMSQALDELSPWEERDNLSFMLAPHAPYTCNPAYQRQVARMAQKHHVGIHTHISESAREVREVREQYGISPVALMADNGLLTPNTVAAHCVHLDDEDIATLARHGVSVAHNPASNLKLANGVAPVEKLRAAGVNVCLGTDGTASNNALNMFREINLAATLHKGLSGDPQLITAGESLAMATVNGARALGLGDRIGKIQVGYEADLTIIDLDRPNMQPVNGPLASLVYSASGSEVDTVLVAGKVLYSRGEFMTIDREEVLRQVEKTCRRIGLR